MKTQLIMLDTPIIISGITPEKTFKGNYYLDGRIFHTDKTMLQTGCKEIIAGLPELPQIDFNGFEEQLGIIDVEKLALIKYSIVDSPLETIQKLRREAFIEGFKAAQKLNEKKFKDELKFIKEQLEKITTWDSFKGHPILFYAQNCIDKINSLSQPKVFNIEVEMEDDRTMLLSGVIKWC